MVGLLTDVVADEYLHLTTRLRTSIAYEPHGFCIGVQVEEGICITVEPRRQDRSRGTQDDLPSTLGWLTGHDFI
jgi:hypothetical protein